MMKCTWTRRIIVAIALLATKVQAEGPYKLESATITGAADVLPDRSILVVGQPAPGKVSNAQYTLEVGQVYGLLAAFKGDFNDDFVLDQSDVSVFVNVLLGGDADPVRILEADFNGDGMLDGKDIPTFVQAMLN